MGQTRVGILFSKKNVNRIINIIAKEVIVFIFLEMIRKI